MAINTRGSVRRAQRKRGKTKSQGCTKDTDSCLYVISKTAVSRGNRDESLSVSCLYARGAELNKDKKVALDADFTVKEDKLEYYASLV
jgi:hypothetical protein